MHERTYTLGAAVYRMTLVGIRSQYTQEFTISEFISSPLILYYYAAFYDAPCTT